jgi:hypothetical protein
MLGITFALAVVLCSPAEVPVRPAAHAAFLEFTAPLEGVTDWLYADELGYRTIGEGNKLDTLADAQALAWTRPDGSSATDDDVAAAWEAVGAAPVAMRAQGGGVYAKLAGNQIRVTKGSIADLEEKRLSEIDAVMGRWFTDYEQWPVDAQVGILSMGWAMGPMFLYGYPHFLMYLRAGDWIGASEQCAIAHPMNASIRRRNAANAILFRNASATPDPSVLQWPNDLVPLSPDPSPLAS